VLLISLLFPIGSGMIFFPLLELMALYYWSIFRPTLLPNWLLLVLGLIYDLLHGNIIGIKALTNLAYKYFITSQRRLFINQPFIVIWSGFIIISAIDYIVMMITQLGIHFLNKINITQSLLHWLLNIFLYVIIHLILNKIYLSLPQNNSHEQ
jgi:rod shape-determining protein MreD